jgi:hypothetical protein
MKRFCCVVLLPLLTTWALGQPVHQSQPSNLPNGSEVVVRSLYHDVIARHPVGIPYGANMKSFAPFLSKSLLHRIDLAQACSRDWMRQNQGRVLKAPFGWGEAGLFSGGDEKASPGSFRIERTEAEKDGSFRVDVELMYRPSDGPGVWRVAAIVVREGGHFVVDDVIYLKDVNSSPQAPAEWRLSELLSQGCDGPHWVGYGSQPR